MGIQRMFSRRRETLPRARPEPETNKIQKPELIRSLTQRLGLKQMHVAPTMGTELVPVIVAEDLTRQATKVPLCFAAYGMNPAGGGPAPNWSLWNPPTSGALVRLKRVAMSPMHGNIVNFRITTADVQAITQKAGIRLARGARLPIPEPQLPSQAKFCHGNILSLGLPTWLELPLAFGDQTVPAGASPIFSWEFDNLWLGPGGLFVMDLDGGDEVNRYGHIEWEEEPIT